MGLELAKAYITVRSDQSKLRGDFMKGKAMVLGSIGAMARSASSILATIGAPVAGIAGFVSLANAGETFNRKMRNSQAIMGELSAQMRGEMKTAAFEVAAATKFSAAEAAESYFFLASAGLDAKQSIAALPQVAQFAQAGMFDMALATDLATDAQSAMGLTVDDAAQNLVNLTRVTDVLVGANTLANASVQQFSESLTGKAGSAARNLGLSLEETVGVLTVFADQGLKASDAGTAFDIVLRELDTKARNNEAAFKAAGVEVFKTSGEMNTMADIIAMLETHLEGASTEMKGTKLEMLGFQAKSVGFVKKLLDNSGAIRDNTAALHEMGGITREIAAKQLTPLQKGMAKLGAAWTEMGASMMTALGPAIETSLTFLADMVTKVQGFMVELGFVFRNWSKLVQVAFIDLSIGMIEAMKNAGGFMVGMFNGIRAFFGSVIESIITGFMGLKDVVMAVNAGVTASLAAMMKGSFTTAAKAGQQAFTTAINEALSKRSIEDPIAAGFKAFQEGSDVAKMGLDKLFGLDSFSKGMKQQRDGLLNDIAKSELAIAKAANQTTGTGKGPAAPAAVEEEVAAAAAKEAAALGNEAAFTSAAFGELGSSIQDAIFGNKQEELQRDANATLETIAENTKGNAVEGGGGGAVLPA